jgi:hypothetical protein
MTITHFQTTIPITRIERVPRMAGNEEGMTANPALGMATGVTGATEAGAVAEVEIVTVTVESTVLLDSPTPVGPKEKTSKIMLTNMVTNDAGD